MLSIATGGTLTNQSATLAPTTSFGGSAEVIGSNAQWNFIDAGILTVGLNGFGACSNTEVAL